MKVMTRIVYPHLGIIDEVEEEIFEDIEEDTPPSIRIKKHPKWKRNS